MCLMRNYIFMQMTLYYTVLHLTQTKHFSTKLTVPYLFIPKGMKWGQMPCSVLLRKRSCMGSGQPSTARSSQNSDWLAGESKSCSVLLRCDEGLFAQVIFSRVRILSPAGLWSGSAKCGDGGARNDDMIGGPDGRLVRTYSRVAPCWQHGDGLTGRSKHAINAGSQK